jgi:hypothetical protein
MDRNFVLPTSPMFIVFAEWNIWLPETSIGFLPILCPVSALNIYILYYFLGENLQKKESKLVIEKNDAQVALFLASYFYQLDLKCNV